MVTRKELNTKRRQVSYRTFISNGQKHYVVDTCRTLDHGNESMVFACDEDGVIIDWLDLDCDCFIPDEAMKDRHEAMVSRWICKLEDSRLLCKPEDNR